MKEVMELEGKLEVAKAKEKLLQFLNSEQWHAIAKVVNAEYPGSHADKEKLLNKVLGAKQAK